MQTCTFFATFTVWLTRELEKADSDLCGTSRPRGMSAHQWAKYQTEKADRPGEAAPSAADTAARLEKISETLQKYEFNFSKHLQILLDSLNHYAATETVVLLGLCARLSTANQGTQFSGLRADDEGSGGG